jgi:hypothetical protein
VLPHLLVAQLAPERARTRPVDRPVDDDPMEPGTEWPARIEALERPDRGEEGLLRDVLGGGRVVDDEVGGPVGTRPVLAEQVLDIRHGSGPGAPDRGPLPTPEARHSHPTIRGHRRDEVHPVNTTPKLWKVHRLRA